MKSKSNPFRLATLILFLIVAGIACKKNNGGNTPTLGANYFQTNLVSDTSSFNPTRIDPALVNAWGLAINPKGILWIAGNGSGMTTVYDTNGNTLIPPVNMPFHGGMDSSAPSGVVFNPNPNSFMNPVSHNASLFIWATENGAVEVWSAGDTATTVAVDNSAQNSVYKGLAIAAYNGANYLYVTDFHNSKICVFDQQFNPVNSISLVDPNLPANYGPFNIACFGGQLYVTYALHMAPDNHDDQAGPGNGFVDVFSPGGTLVKRFASQGPLNSPWGLAQVPDNGFGVPIHSILVGNFGDGWINVFDSTGKYLGPLQSSSTSGAYGGTTSSPIAIGGLWAIEFGNTITGGNPDKLYFTAGPYGENHGLFGYILP